MLVTAGLRYGHVGTGAQSISAGHDSITSYYGALAMWTLGLFALGSVPNQAIFIPPTLTLGGSS